MRGGAHADTAAAAVGGVGEVADLGFEEGVLEVYEEDFGADGLEDEGVGECGAYVAAAEDGDCSFEFGLGHSFILFFSLDSELLLLLLLLLLMLVVMLFIVLIE